MLGDAPSPLSHRPLRSWGSSEDGRTIPVVWL
jgi:hypothetical protein